MDGPESDPSAVLAEPSSSPHGIADLDAYEEAQLDQIEAEIEAEKRNVFISSLKDTTDLQELVQRAKGTPFCTFVLLLLVAASHLAGAVQALSRAGITTADDIVCLPRTEVCTKGRLTNEVYYSLLQHASMPFLPQMYAASEWREHQNVRSPLITHSRQYSLAHRCISREAGSSFSGLPNNGCFPARWPSSVWHHGASRRGGSR